MACSASVASSVSALLLEFGHQSLAMVLVVLRALYLGWTQHHWFSGFQIFQVYHLLSWVSSLQRADCGIASINYSHEPISFNKEISFLLFSAAVAAKSLQS